jgi:hypothetical protein
MGASGLGHRLQLESFNIYVSELEEEKGVALTGLTLTLGRDKVLTLNNNGAHCKRDCFPCGWMDLNCNILTDIEVGSFEDKG